METKIDGKTYIIHSVLVDDLLAAADKNNGELASYLIIRFYRASVYEKFYMEQAYKAIKKASFRNMGPVSNAELAIQLVLTISKLPYKGAHHND